MISSTRLNLAIVRPICLCSVIRKPDKGINLSSIIKINHSIQKFELYLKKYSMPTLRKFSFVYFNCQNTNEWFKIDAQ